MLCIYVSTGQEGYNEEADSDRTQTLATSVAHRHLGFMGLAEYLPSTRDMLTDGDDAAGPKSSKCTYAALWIGPLFMKPGSMWLHTYREHHITLGHLPDMSHVDRYKLQCSLDEVCQTWLMQRRTPFQCALSMMCGRQAVLHDDHDEFGDEIELDL